MSFLQAAGLQRRRFIGFAIEVTGGLAMLVGVWMLRADREALFGIFMLGGMAIGLVGFCYSVFAIRCPACGSSLTWHAYSKVPYQDWGLWLETFEQCPRCRFRPDASQVTAGGGTTTSNDAA
jgi:hypothetical protein